MRLTPFSSGGPFRIPKFVGLPLMFLFAFAIAGALIAAARPEPTTTVTNLPEQSRGFYAGVAATLAVLMVLAREGIVFAKWFLERRRARNGESEDDSRIPSSATRTNPGGIPQCATCPSHGELMGETRKRLDAAWRELDKMKVHRRMMRIKMRTVLELNPKLDALNNRMTELDGHVAELASAASEKMERHIEIYHPPK